MVSGSLALLYFLFGFHGGRQGSGPDRGQSPVEWGDYPSVRPSIRPPPLGHPARHEAQPAIPEAWLAGPQAWLDSPDEGTYIRTYEQTENLPILQDFVPYRGRCPRRAIFDILYV